MPRLSWVIPCESVAVDRFANTVSLFHVIEELHVSQNVPDPEPGKAQRAQGFVVVSHWVREDADKPESAKARLALFGPKSRKPLGHSAFDIDLVSFKRARQLSHLPAFPYVGEGDYLIEVQIQRAAKWRSISRMLIELKKVSAVSEAATNGPGV